MKVTEKRADFFELAMVKRLWRLNVKATHFYVINVVMLLFVDVAFFFVVHCSKKLLAWLAKPIESITS